MTPESALTFLFTTEKGPWGPQAAFGELIEAGAKLIDESWVKNHYKWIVWKLACLARRFAQTLDFWNPETVLNQLKYRYEQEVNLSRRSAIKMMLEQDGHPGRTLVLCVSAVMDDVQGTISEHKSKNGQPILTSSSHFFQQMDRRWS